MKYRSFKSWVPQWLRKWISTGCTPFYPIYKDGKIIGREDRIKSLRQSLIDCGLVKYE